MIKMRNVRPICGSGKSVAGMFVFFPHPMSLVNKAAGKDTVSKELAQNKRDLFYKNIMGLVLKP